MLILGSVRWCGNELNACCNVCVITYRYCVLSVLIVHRLKRLRHRLFVSVLPSVGRRAVVAATAVGAG